MRVAGGIISLIAGILAFLAALLTISIGGAAAAFEAEGGETVLALGFGGVFFSFLVIVFGAIAIGIKGRKWPGICLIVSSILGAVLGGTFVAVLLVLSLIGGVLILFDKTPRTSAYVAASDTTVVEQAGGTPKSGGKTLKIIGIGTLILIALIVAVALIPTSDTKLSTESIDNSNFSSTAEELSKEKETLHVNHHGAYIGNFEVQIDAVSFTDRVGSDFFENQANNGELYVTGVMSYKNIGNKPISAFSTPNLHLIDANGNRYDANIGISALYATDLNINQNVLSDINPGITHQDSSVFVVAENLFDPELWKYEVVLGGESVIFSISPTFKLNEPAASEAVHQPAIVQSSQATVDAPTNDLTQNDYSFLLDRTWSDLSMAYVRSKLGVAKRIDHFTEAGIYEFGECIILIKGDTTIDFLEFSSACDGEWKSLIFNWNADQKFNGSTLGDLVLYFSSFEIDGCIHSCGNSADPEITLKVEGSRADGFIQLELISVQDDDLTIDRVDTIEDYLKSNGIEAYSFEELKGPEMQTIIYRALKDVPIDRVRLGSYENWPTVSPVE